MAFDKLKDKKVPEKTLDSIFTKLKELEVVPGLKVGMYGFAETGKTFFIGTCPEPVYVIDTEFGAKQVFKYHFPDRDIRVFEVKVVQKDPTQLDYEATFGKIEDAVYAARNLDEGTFAIDSMSDVYTWMNAWVEAAAPRYKSKKSGESFMMQTEWGKRNNRYRNMVFRLISLPINIVFASQMKKEYGERGSSAEGKQIGYVPRWLEQHDHWVDVLLHSEKWDLKDKGTKRMSTITKCRMHSAGNLRIEDVTYPKLLKLLLEKFRLKIEGVDYGKL